MWEGDIILRAMDIKGVYPEDYGAVCAAFRAVPTYLDCSDSDSFPAQMCGYARKCIGYAARMRDLGIIPPEN